MESMPLFLLAVALVLMTPGPTNALLTTSAMLTGARRSMILILPELGAYLMVIATLTAIDSAYVATGSTVQAVFRGLMTAYLLYLAWHLWTKSAHLVEGNGVVSKRHVFTTTLLNPKSLVFALAIFPAQHHYINYLPYFAGFAVVLIVVSTSWIVFGRYLRTLKGCFHCKVISRVAASVICAFGVVLGVTTVTAALAAG